MLDKLQAVEDKYLELESLISDPDVIADMPKWQKYNQEHAALTELVDKFREYKKICKTIDEDKAMFDEDIDDDMRHMLEDEVKELSEKLEEEYNTSADIYVVSDLVKKQLIKNAIIAVLVAFLGITAYVSIRFRFNYAISGIAALLHDVLITTIFFGVFKLEIDSIFIAALLTIIGYSINDTIVTFDMIRRNYKNRKNIDKEKNKELIDEFITEVGN